MTYKNPPRIIHYTESLGGGVLRAIEILSKAQIESGCDVSLVYLRREITPPKQQLAINLESVQLIELHRSSAFGMLKMFSHATFWMLKNRKGVIHAHSSWAGAVVRIASSVQFKRRIFYTPHGFSFLRQDVSKFKKIFFQFSESILGKMGESTLLACSNFEESSGKELGIKRIKRLGNFIEDPKAKYLQKTYPSTHTDLVVGTVGRICVQKNPEMYLKVVEKFLPKISCRWIGAGDEKETRSLENAGVWVSGWLNKGDVYSELSQLKVFIMTSRWEGLPITALEALAFGIPIVSIGFSGCDEIVIDGETGFICQNESEMVDAIDKLLQDKQLCDLMSKNSVTHFKQNFDYRLLIDSWELAYSL